MFLLIVLVLAPVDHGMACDGCTEPIVGVRYQCTTCPNFVSYPTYTHTQFSNTTHVCFAVLFSLTVFRIFLRFIQNLCAACESVDQSHDPTHIFAKIKRKTTTPATVNKNSNNNNKPATTAAPTTPTTPRTATPPSTPLPVAHCVSNESKTLEGNALVHQLGNMLPGSTVIKKWNFFNYGPLAWPAGTMSVDITTIVYIIIWLLLTTVECFSLLVLVLALFLCLTCFFLFTDTRLVCVEGHPFGKPEVSLPIARSNQTVQVSGTFIDIIIA